MRPRAAPLARTALVVALVAAAAATAPGLAGETGADGGFAWALPEWMPTPPVPDDNPMSVAAVDLGRHLFYDARLSADRSIACASCHVQGLAFTDGRQTSIGAHGVVGPATCRRSPMPPTSRP